MPRLSRFLSRAGALRQKISTTLSLSASVGLPACNNQEPSATR